MVDKAGNFTIEETAIPEVKLISLKLFPDDRGFFAEFFRNDVLKSFGINAPVQGNRSESRPGVIRGLHYQSPSQAKIVEVILGRILDVAVDIRLNSPTFGKHVMVELTGRDNKQLYIPEGFAHGFQVIGEDSAIVQYFCSSYYAPKAQLGIAWNSPQLKIEWDYKLEAIVSDKDNELPLLGGILSNNLPRYSP